jgi:prophage regulatory protein
MHDINSLPTEGFVREWQILGRKKAVPPIAPIIPVGRTQWWAGIKSGRYPAPVKLSERVTAWRVSDIRALIERLAVDGCKPTPTYKDEVEERSVIHRRKSLERDATRKKRP